MRCWRSATATCRRRCRGTGRRATPSTSRTARSGRLTFFLARDSQSDSFVGMAAIFPTQLRVFGELVPAAVAGEFAVDDGHRGLGPAVPLQRAAVGALGERGLACAYGYPNEHSEPITRRVGYVDLGRLTRYVKVLRSRILVEQYGRGRVAPAWGGSLPTRCCPCSRASGSTGAGARFGSSGRPRSTTVSPRSGRPPGGRARSPASATPSSSTGSTRWAGRRASTGPLRWSALTSRSRPTPSIASATASATSSTSSSSRPRTSSTPCSQS